MSTIADLKTRTLGSIAAIQTLLERYPVLTTNANLDGENTSFGFMLNVLKIIGVTKEDVIEWVSNILCGKGTDGFLVGLEEAVKGILLANVKKLFTCDINPIIPNDLMYPNESDENKVTGEGLSLSLDTVDMFGYLNNCPTNEKGSVFYFDAKNPIYNEYLDEGSQLPSYTIDELWKSCDFNAYLWYVVNKGNSIGAQGQKLMWDNRVKYISQFADDESLRKNFFDYTNPCIYPTNKIKGGGEHTAEKKQIIRCEYKEHPSSGTGANVLRIWLNPYRYFHTRAVTYKGFTFFLNKTIFEFNYDYIYSLKLFDTKTLVASIVNAVTGLSMNISGQYSIMQSLVAGKVGSIVKNIINSSDEESYDCYFKFSNEEYDKLLQESIDKHNGVYRTPYEAVSVDYDKIIDSLNGIDSASTYDEKKRAVENVFTSVTATSAENGVEYSRDNWTWGLDVVYQLIEQTITQLVMEVLSPKVAILYKVNQMVMGDIDPQSETWKTDVFSNWEYFMKKMWNLVTELTKEISELVLEQLYEYMMSQLEPLLELFVSKILKETITDYRRLLEQILDCIPSFNFNTSKAATYIDNVSYADIVPTQEQPKKEC